MLHIPHVSQLAHTDCKSRVPGPLFRSCQQQTKQQLLSVFPALLTRWLSACLYLCPVCRAAPSMSLTTVETLPSSWQQEEVRFVLTLCHNQSLLLGMNKATDLAHTRTAGAQTMLARRMYIRTSNYTV
jgi:hypothetical protein